MRVKKQSRLGQQNQPEAETETSGGLGVTVVPSGVLGVTVVPWNSAAEHRVSHEQDAPKQQGSTRRHGRDRRLGAAARLAGANAAEDLVAVRSCWSRAKLLGSMRPIGVVFLEQSTRLGSPLRSPLWRGKGVFHSSMPCARRAAGERSQGQCKYPPVVLPACAHRRGGRLLWKLLVPVGVALRAMKAGRVKE